MISSIVDPRRLYGDNNGAIAQLKKSKSHLRSKHVFRCHYLFKEIVYTNDIKIEEVLTKENVADPFTVALSQKRHDSRAYGLKQMSDWF